MSRAWSPGGAGARRGAVGLCQGRALLATRIMDEDCFSPLASLAGSSGGATTSISDGSAPRVRPSPAPGPPAPQPSSGSSGPHGCPGVPSHPHSPTNSSHSPFRPPHVGADCGHSRPSWAPAASFLPAGTALWVTASSPGLPGRRRRLSSIPSPPNPGTAPATQSPRRLLLSERRFGWTDGGADG